MLGLQTAMGIATQTNNAVPEVQEKTLSIMDMIIDGGTGNIIIIGVLFLMLGWHSISISNAHLLSKQLRK